MPGRQSAVFDAVSRTSGLILWLAMVPVASAATPSQTESEKRPAGHSAHGEAFNEGPRQSAYLMRGVGNVSFPVTTVSTDAQQFFNQGIGQLHGFWYFEAERSFRQVAALDPQCPMAYWGMAMANVNNRERAKKFIAKAIERLEHATPRERLWIDALRRYHEQEEDTAAAKQQYVRSLEAIAQQLPDDIEPKAFLALQIWSTSSGSCGKGGSSMSRQAVDSLLDEVFRSNPMHPAHHYRIHLWDDENPSRALRSAALCGQAAPAIAHMWHMPGHIFDKLHRYADAAWQQEASARVDHARMIRDRILPDQIHNYAHNNEWLVRNLAHVGRVHEAVALAKNMCDLPRHPKFNAPDKQGTSASYGRQRLMEVLVDYELWDEMLAMKDSFYLASTSVALEQAQRAHALGLAFSAKGKPDGLAEQIQALTKILDQERMAAYTAASAKLKKAESEDKPADQAETLAGRELKQKNNAIAQIEELHHDLLAHSHLTRGELKDAQAQLASVTRFNHVHKDASARAYLTAGAKEKAKSLAQEAIKEAPGKLRPLATAIEVSWRKGDKQVAATHFEELRRVAPHADLDLPILTRLAPIAKALNLPDDWRIVPEVPLDVGARPPLASLGPLRWQPSVAPAWSLPDGGGGERSLQSYRGKPIILIFYLGFGCPHCVQQLQAFEPVLGDFAAAGISVVAISSQGVSALRQSIARTAAREPYPIPILSDSSHTVFKAYRAFDDFEQTPLHATVLIDGEGLIRWQDISYEPFQDPKFLLEEARRLLAIAQPSL